MRFRKPRKIRLIIIACLLINSAAAVYGARSLEEYRELKRQWVYNVARFVTWPARSFSLTDTPFIVGIIGEELQKAEDLFKGKTIQGRKVEVKRFNSAYDVKFCHLLYISASQKNSVSSIIMNSKRLKPSTGGGTSRVLTSTSSAILTISDMENFIQKGGMVQLVVKENKIRFQVNQTSAKKAGLKISSQLLKLADSVQ
ncbi:MAG: YfiR family protein [Candidatus Omnitrophica bacterium]|nr:YfiR family protein [Candidatus Omnitrophota bacterium]